MQAIRQKIRNLAAGTQTLLQFINWLKLKEYLGESRAGSFSDPFSKQEQKNILVLAPHPDDDVLGCGGTIARHCLNGDKVHIVYLADGSHGTKTGQRDTALIKKRRNEAKHGLVYLGGGESYFYYFKDGGVKVTEDIENFLAKIISEIDPALVYIPWLGDDHPDHQQAGKILAHVLKLASSYHIKEVWQYEIWTPLIANRLISIKEVLDKKTKAIEAHQSQLACRAYKDGVLGLNSYRGAIANLDGPAEAFFALSVKNFLDFSERFFGARGIRGNKRMRG